MGELCVCVSRSGCSNRGGVGVRMRVYPMVTPCIHGAHEQTWDLRVMYLHDRRRIAAQWLWAGVGVSRTHRKSSQPNRLSTLHPYHAQWIVNLVCTRFSGGQCIVCVTLY